MRMDDREFSAYFRGMIIGGLVTACATAAAITLVYFSPIRNRTIPRIDEVQPGFIAPSKLEVELQDVDGKGLGTIVKIEGKPYLLKTDEQGRPQLIEELKK